MSAEVEIIGRQSSHYTRMVRILAEELGVAYRLTPVLDLMSRDPDTYAGNPALKLPVARVGEEVVFGSMNICRVLARRAGAEDQVAWPEQVDSTLLMNAHEILSHAMAAEVDVVVHEIVEQRPVDNAAGKRRESLFRCLEWLDANVLEVQAALSGRAISTFDIGLYCLVSHLPFRNPVDLSGMPRLRAFEHAFADRASARETHYRFDAPRGGSA